MGVFMVTTAIVTRVIAPTLKTNGVHPGFEVSVRRFASGHCTPEDRSARRGGTTTCQEGVGRITFGEAVGGRTHDEMVCAAFAVHSGGDRAKPKLRRGRAASFRRKTGSSRPPTTLIYGATSPEGALTVEVWYPSETLSHWTVRRSLILKPRAHHVRRLSRCWRRRRRDALAYGRVRCEMRPLQPSSGRARSWF